MVLVLDDVQQLKLTLHSHLIFRPRNVCQEDQKNTGDSKKKVSFAIIVTCHVMKVKEVRIFKANIHLYQLQPHLFITKLTRALLEQLLPDIEALTTNT